MGFLTVASGILRPIDGQGDRYRSEARQIYFTESDGNLNIGFQRRSDVVTFSCHRRMFRENGVVEIESVWTARDRELKISGGPARTFLCPG